MLPQVKTITYPATLPSSKKKVKIRPFDGAEEKMLLTAKETQDSEIVTDTIFQIINNCVVSDVDFDSLPMVDIEYLFLKIRAVSVSDIIEIILKCQHCDGESGIRANIPVDKIEVEGALPEDFKISELEDGSDLMIKVRQLQYGDAKDLDESDDDYDVKVIFHMIETMYSDNGEVYWDEEKIEFEKFKEWFLSIQGAYSTFFKNITNLPKLSMDIKVPCPDCREENEFHFEGLVDFFQ